MKKLKLNTLEEDLHDIGEILMCGESLGLLKRILWTESNEKFYVTENEKVVKEWKPFEICKVLCRTGDVV